MFKVQDGLSFYNMGSKWEFAVPSCYTNVDIYSDFNHIKANLHPEKIRCHTNMMTIHPLRLNLTTKHRWRAHRVHLSSSTWLSATTWSGMLRSRQVSVKMTGLILSISFCHNRTSARRNQKSRALFSLVRLVGSVGLKDAVGSDRLKVCGSSSKTHTFFSKDD